MITINDRYGKEKDQKKKKKFGWTAKSTSQMEGQSEISKQDPQILWLNQAIESVQLDCLSFLRISL